MTSSARLSHTSSTQYDAHKKDYAVSLTGSPFNCAYRLSTRFLPSPILLIELILVMGLEHAVGRYYVESAENDAIFASRLRFTQSGDSFTVAAAVPPHSGAAKATGLGKLRVGLPHAELFNLAAELSPRQKGK